MAGLRQAAELLHRLLKRILPAQRLQLRHQQRRSHQAILQRRGHPVDLVPVLHDEVVSDRPAKHRVEGSAIGALPGPVDHLVGQIAKPRGKPQAESFAESEDEVRVPVRIRVVLLDAVCILVEDAVHEVRRLAGVAADDLHRELGYLV